MNQMSVHVSELVNGSFAFFLWANNDTIKKRVNPDESADTIIDLKLIGECHIGINKFFFSDAEIVRKCPLSH
jgi:hypothetical protein